MDKKPTVKIIVGLGNPGASYARTYHNVGLIALDMLIAHGAGTTTRKQKTMAKRGLFESVRLGAIVAVHPRVFMNESGKAVRSALRAYGAKPSDLILIHDDSDLVLGAYTISFDRGAAGHRGVQSVIDAVGTKKFTRLRIGVRKDTGQAGRFVLNRISPADLKILHSVLSGAIVKLMENERP